MNGASGPRENIITSPFVLGCADSFLSDVPFIDVPIWLRSTFFTPEGVELGGSESSGDMFGIWHTPRFNQRKRGKGSDLAQKGRSAVTARAPSSFSSCQRDLRA
jgi:hypothetical protein